jgi:hypothetical protein
MEESQGWLSTGDYGEQTELDPSDELFNIIRADDLPPHLRDHVTSHGFSSSAYPGVSGGVDGVMAWAWNLPVMLAAEGAAEQWRAETSQDATSPRLSEPATTTVWVLVTRLSSDDAASAVGEEFLPFGADDGEQLLVLRGIDDFDAGAEFGDFEFGDFDFEEAARDNERTYSERRREPINVSGLGDHAYGERRAVAVLDYDADLNTYRSDQMLRWEYTETVGFMLGRYTVMVTRSAASPTDVLPADFDIRALGETIAARLGQLVP